MDHKKTVKNCKEVGNTKAPVLRNLYTAQKATGRTGHEQETWFQIGKIFIKATLMCPTYLT